MESIMTFNVIVIGIAVLCSFIFLYNSIVIVGGEQIVVLERRWFGAQLPAGRVVAMADQVGIQARTLGPGLHLLIPFIYTVIKHPMIIIKETEVGVVESIDGVPVTAGRIFAKAVEGHNLFQDGEAFLKSQGEKGPQIQILPPGTYRINGSARKTVSG